MEEENSALRDVMNHASSWNGDPSVAASLVSQGAFRRDSMAWNGPVKWPTPQASTYLIILGNLAVYRNASRPPCRL